GGRPGVRLLLLDENRQFAGGLNAGAAAAIAAGAARLLLLNNDTVLAPDALGRLAAALDARPRAGIAGPRLMDLREPARELSAGERHILPLLCLPRTWLRYRPRTPAPYPVTGVMGAALLVTRACYQAVGGFAAEIEVYYEDVDFCLAARPGPTRVRSRPRWRPPAGTSTSSSRTGPRRSPALGWRRSTCRSRAPTIRRCGITGGSRGSSPRAASTSTTGRRTCSPGACG